MACCGQKRTALRRASPGPGGRPGARPGASAAGAVGGSIATPIGSSVAVAYRGPQTVRVRGQATGRVYEFSTAAPIRDLHPGDAAIILRSPAFRRA